MALLHKSIPHSGNALASGFNPRCIVKKELRLVRAARYAQVKNIRFDSFSCDPTGHNVLLHIPRVETRGYQRIPRMGNRFMQQRPFGILPFILNSGF